MKIKVKQEEGVKFYALNGIMYPIVNGEVEIPDEKQVVTKEKESEKESKNKKEKE